MAVYDTPAFKQCMLSRGYRFEFTKVVQDAPSAATRSVAQRSYTGPSVTFSIGGGGDDEAASTAADNNDWAAQQEQSAMTRRTRAMLRMLRLRLRTSQRPRPSTRR
jgi:hypothetical protein